MTTISRGPQVQPAGGVTVNNRKDLVSATLKHPSYAMFYKTVISTFFTSARALLFTPVRHILRPYVWMALVAEHHVAIIESGNKVLPFGGDPAVDGGKGRGTHGTSMRSFLPSLSPGWSSPYFFGETRSMEEPDESMTGVLYFYAHPSAVQELLVDLLHWCPHYLPCLPLFS